MYVSLLDLSAGSRASHRYILTYAFLIKIYKSCWTFYITFLWTWTDIGKNMNFSEFYRGKNIKFENTRSKNIIFVLLSRREKYRNELVSISIESIQHKSQEEVAHSPCQRPSSIIHSRETGVLIQKESFQIQHSLRYQYTPFVIIHVWVFLPFSFPSFFLSPFSRELIYRSRKFIRRTNSTR